MYIGVVNLKVVAVHFSSQRFDNRLQCSKIVTECNCILPIISRAVITVGDLPNESVLIIYLCFNASPKNLNAHHLGRFCSFQL